MYRVIIADDEIMVREGLKESIEWDACGLEFAGEASDGVEALALISEVKPKILITDIKMPDMDGIELIKKIHESNFYVKIIILSGYNDFFYLKEAIKYGVESYLLKPIDDEELTSILISTVQSIEEEITSEIKVREGMQLLRNNTLTRLVTHSIGTKEFREKADFLNIHILGYNQMACVAYISGEEFSKVSERDKKLKTFAALNICEEILHQKKMGVVFSDLGGQIVLILNDSENELKLEVLQKTFEEIQQAIHKYQGITMTIGMGEIVPGVERLHESYRQANECAQYASVMKHKTIVHFNSINLDNDEFFQCWGIDTEKLEARIMNNEKDQLSSALSEMFGRVSDNESNASKQIRDALYGLVYFLMRKFSDASGTNLDFTITKIGFKYEELSSLKKISELETWTRLFCYKIMDSIPNHIHKKASRLVQDTIKYIHSNYDRDISLKSISTQLFVNCSYLGQIFRKDMKESFTDYINRFRVDKAKELLADSNMKVYEIAEKVGFTDSHYFLKIFKKHAGVNPSDIRKGK